MKITIMGRPGKVVEKNGVFLTSVKQQKTPSLPKDLPVPPANPTPYLLYITGKQWRRVATAVENPEDQLVVEGYPYYDKDLKAMAVFAIRTTTKFQEAERRAAQRAALAAKQENEG